MAYGSTSLHVNNVNGMLAKNAKRIFWIMSHVLEQIQAARIGVICRIASSKLSTSCLHGNSVSVGKIQASSTFFWEAIFATPPTVLAVTIHTLPWKMRVEKTLFLFWYGILPGSFRFQVWCGHFQFSSEIHEHRPSSSCDALPADRRNKTLECILATLDVSSAIMSHALEQIKTA